MEYAEEIIEGVAASMPEQVYEIVKGELFPLMSEGICAGFVIGTLFSLAAYGIFKAISLLGIKNISG